MLSVKMNEQLKAWKGNATARHLLKGIGSHKVEGEKGKRKTSLEKRHQKSRTFDCKDLGGGALIVERAPSHGGRKGV